MATEEAFMTAIERVLKLEGGYVNDPNDAGGETNFGISKRSYPDKDIANLSRADAVAIYHRDFWVQTGIVSLSDCVAGACFDLSVNMGPGPAIKITQQAIGDAGLPIAADGRLGPATISASQRVDAVAVIAFLRWRAAKHYMAIVAGNPNDERYLDGWLRRACALI